MDILLEALIKFWIKRLINQRENSICYDNESFFMFNMAKNWYLERGDKMFWLSMVGEIR